MARKEIELAVFKACINLNGKLSIALSTVEPEDLRNALNSLIPQYNYTDDLIEQYDYVLNRMKEISEDVSRRYEEDDAV